MRVLSLVCLLLVTAACSRFADLQKNGTVDEKYAAAMSYYAKGGKGYYKAGLLFEEIIPLIQGKGEEGEKAQFFAAYCKYHQGLYLESAASFQKFYQTFGRSGYAEEAQFMHAYSLFKDSPNYNLDQSNTLTAMETLQTFINSYPTSKYRDQCQQIINYLRVKLETKAYENAKLYYKIGSADVSYHRSAVVMFDNFQKNFPDSGYNEEVGYLKIVAQYQVARNSFESKQKDRYTDVVKFYEAFLDKYPASKYLKDAERLYSRGVAELAELNKLPTPVTPAASIGK